MHSEVETVHLALEMHHSEVEMVRCALLLMRWKVEMRCSEVEMPWRQKKERCPTFAGQPLKARGSWLVARGSWLVARGSWLVAL